LISGGLKIECNVKLTSKFESLTDHVQDFADFNARVAGKKPPSDLCPDDFFPEARIFSVEVLVIVDNGTDLEKRRFLLEHERKFSSSHWH
jgi:hypothetical protein